MSSRPDDQDARDRVRDSHAETLFVEAGAGTGKTTALVARVVQMVATAHVDAIGRLAAITFTENAAAELRSRIREGLGEAARGSYRGTAFDQIQQARCRAAVATLDDAVITTLHGFASRILAEAPLEAGLAPGFGVGDTMGTGAAAEEGWRDFLDDLMDDHTVRGHLLAGLALGLRLGDLRGVAAALSGSWDRLRVRPLRERVLPVIDASEVLDPLRAALRDDGRWPDDDHLTGHLRGTVTNLATELAALDHPLDLLDALSRADIKCGKGKAPSWRAAGLDKKVVVDALNDAERARTDLLAAVGAAVTETLAARVQDWLLTAADRRRADGELEFHDLLVLARDVLRADPVVRRRLHAQWPVLLIDEFQDTDPLQVEIACLLAGHGDGDPPEEWADIDVAPGRLFFVGDPKQSIYRFRRADVASYTSVGGLHYTRRTGLSVNFRSMPGVLDAVNHTFRTLIGADADAGIPYADLLPSRPADGEGPPVLLLGGPQKDADAAALREVEAAHLADVIVRAKAEGWPVHASGTTRPASYQDMAILLPTRTPLPTLERSLQDRSVPYRVESRSLVWATDAVRDLVTLLQAIDNPADEVALLAALRHPGLACSDVDLVAWRASGGRWSVFATVPDGLDQDHPVAAALATLRGWHDQRWWLPVNHLVEQVVRELRLIELTGAQHRPRDHWRRLRFVVDQARAWCDAGGSGLRGFVTWAAQQIENDADVLETVVPEADDDAVRILTVHGSKGLEFPITMVAGLGGTGRSPSPVLWTGDGPRVRLKARVLEMAGWPDAADEEKVQARREDIRLLYVAITRAMDHLVLGCYHKPPKSPGAQRSAAQQLWGLLANGVLARSETHPRARRGLAPAIGDGIAAVAGLPSRETFRAGRAGLLNEIAARVATSPTTLTKDAEAGPDSGVPVSQGERRGSRQGTAIGTAVHRVMELVDFASPMAEEVRRLAEFACAEQRIPQLVRDVESRAWSALGNDAVRVVRGGRSWREVYLVVKDGERYVEGYIDLLAETSSGELEVVDYKTDRVDSAEDVAAKEAHYAPQLTAYARAVGQVLGRAPGTTALVFARRTAGQGE